MKVARILCIDGGGIRGLIPATIIKLFEDKLNSDIANHFHMIAGTSTGGILACALANKVKANEIIGFYEKSGPSIFSSSVFKLGGLAGVMYDGQNVLNAVKPVIKGTLSSVEPIDLLVTSYDIEKRSPYLFKSWKARGYELDKNEVSSSFDFSLSDVCRSTSAAPTYFTPYKAKSLDGTNHALVDGGVFANNPAMCAYVAARRLYPKADEYMIVSLGTGSLTKPIKYNDAVNYGLADWLRPLLDIMFDGVSATTEYELSQLGGVSQYRFQTSLAGGSEAMDDASEGNLNVLKALALDTTVKYKSEIDSLLGRLDDKMAPYETLGYPKQTDLPKPIESVKIAKKTKVTKTNSATATAGAIAGGLIGGPVGAVIGGLGGWAMGFLNEKPV